MEIDLSLAKVARKAVGTGRLVVVCGLTKEGDLVQGANLSVVACGGNALALQDRLDALDPSEIAALVSFGIAGALDPALGIGDVIVPDAVTTAGRQHFAADPRLLKAWREKLPEERLHGEGRSLIGVDEPALTRGDKSRLRRSSGGASAVDMESHLVAAYAARHEKPFGVLRVISDEAGQDLPEAARNALNEDGSVDVVGVIGAVLRRPGDIPALIKTGRNAKVAFEALGRVGRLLGGRLGLDL